LADCVVGAPAPTLLGVADGSLEGGALEEGKLEDGMLDEGIVDEPLPTENNAVVNYSAPVRLAFRTGIILLEPARTIPSERPSKR
jgi:hypothetical protein